MTQKEELVAAFDHTLSHKWESLENATRGVTEGEAIWQHPAYADEENELYYPKARTILWHLVHLAHCYKHYTTRVIERPIRPPEPEAPEAKTFEEGVNNLKTYRNELRYAIVSLPDAAFDEKLDNGDTIGEFIRNVIRHDAWHGAQIVFVRRLYRYQSTLKSDSGE